MRRQSAPAEESPLTAAPFGDLRNAQGERLDYACAGDAGPGSDLIVVIGHGVTANKDRAWALSLESALSALGLASLRFSFSGNGASEGDFRASTVSKEVADLGSVLDALGERPICFVGHSMGGAVGVLRASSDSRIRLLVSLAGMVHTHDFAQRKFGALTPERDLMWEKPECPLSRAFLADMAQVGSVLPQASQVAVPWLLIHGDADTVVPCAEAEQAARAASQAELRLIEGADHLFSGAHEAAVAAAVAAWVHEAARA